MASPEIFQGFWQNYSNARVWGWTWTLSDASANYLLVFLGIYLGFVGGSFWTIIAFLIHQWMAGENPGDGIHHQTQLILRNTPSPLGAAKELASLAFQWRTVESRSRVIKPLLFSLLPFTIAFGFIVAGIESTRISAGDAAANEVKIKPQNCGQTLWNVSTPSPPEIVAFATFLTQNGRDARAYAQSCYGNSTAQKSPSACTSYPVGQIPYSTSLGQPCPFDDALCVTGPDTSITMDTGLYDSHTVLGINAPKSNRAFLRKLATCTVLQSSDYSNHTTTTNSDGSATTSHHLYYGTNSNNPWTYMYTDSARGDGFGYEIAPIISYAGYDDNVWVPISQLYRTDADVSIFILSANGVTYLDAVDDPMYSAHDTSEAPYYRADDYYQVLGCVEQYQVCPAGTGSVICTSIDSQAHVFTQLHEIGLNQAQVAAAELVMNISIDANVFASVFGIGRAALLAGDQVFQEILSESLPDNQWQLEANNFFAISLARLQASVIEFTSKSSDNMVGQYLMPASSDQQRYLCNNQKIRNVGGYESFTAAAVFIIIGVGLIILIISTTIDTCFEAFQKHFQWKYHKVMQWKTDSKFQQQRIAMAESGFGTWTGAYKAIPLIARGEMLAIPRRDRNGMLVYRP